MFLSLCENRLIYFVYTQVVVSYESEITASLLCTLLLLRRITCASNNAIVQCITLYMLAGCDVSRVIIITPQFCNKH